MTRTYPNLTYMVDSSIYGKFGTSMHLISASEMQSAFPEVDEKFVKELRRKYGLAKLQKNKTEMSNLERQLKYYAS